MWLLRRLVGEWRDDRVGGVAAEIAFFAVLSLFPGLLALAAALGSVGALIGDDAAGRAKDAVISFLERVLTDEAGSTLEAVTALFDDTSAGALTVGTAVALWAASRGFVAVIRGLDIAYDIEESRRYVRLRAVALGLAAGSVVVAALMLSVLVVGPLLGTGHEVADRLGFGSGFATLWDWVRWPFALAVIVGWAATIFHVGPNHHTPWRYDLPGALLTTAVWVLVSLGLRVYLSAVGGANQVLGTLGGALIVLFWLYLLSIGLLLGGELNAELFARQLREEEQNAG